MRSIALTILFSVIAATAAQAADNDGAYLDPAYRTLRHPAVTSRMSGLLATTPRASDTLALIDQVTPVRTQASRGTCSMFSTTALLEAMLRIQHGAAARLDLSEEWIEYLIMRETASEGSSTDANLAAYKAHGAVKESTMPYIGEEWKTLDDGIARERCGNLRRGFNLSACLLGHWDPTLLDSEGGPAEFAQARTEAAAFAEEYSDLMGTQYMVPTTAQAKYLLSQGTPVNLDLDFYYGAWNHREAEKIGVPRNLEHFAKGIVGYPAEGSVDRARSHEEPAGHSIMLVGYDDDVVVTVPTLMTDGSTVEKRYRGVYYFKNSWGTEKFGKDFELNGRKFPGYGMITQKYAHEQGQFFRLPLR